MASAPSAKKSAAALQLRVEAEKAVAFAEAAKQQVRAAKSQLKKARKLSKLAKKEAKRARKRAQEAAASLQASHPPEKSIKRAVKAADLPGLVAAEPAAPSAPVTKPMRSAAEVAKSVIRRLEDRAEEGPIEPPPAASGST